MNILLSETLTLTQDTFAGFSWVYGPGTVVNLVFGAIDLGETLTVHIIGKSDLATGTTDYLIEQATIPAGASLQAAYQAIPVPMPNAQWGVLLGATISGGSLSRQFTRVAILL